MMFSLAKLIKPNFESFFPCYVVKPKEGRKEDSKGVIRLKKNQRNKSSFRLF